MKKTLTLTLITLFILSAHAQTDSIPQVEVIARALPDKVILRWATSSPLAWQYANKYGYTIERVTMTKNNKLLKNREIRILTEENIKLLPENQWEVVVKDNTGAINKYAAIAAQAIFGESFELTEDYSSSITKVVQKAQENEMRFTFALYAADKSLKVAKAMGLMYTDNTVAKDEKYLYRVYANVPKEVLPIDTGFIYIGPPDYAELPRPFELHGDFADHSVTLSWNRELFENIYSDYIVERSENAKNFYPIDDLPFLNTTPDKKRTPRLMYRVDSLPENNKTYNYRVKGRTPFDETGPWSDTISGHGFMALKFRPSIINSEIIENSKVELKWDFPKEHNKDIEYFNIYRAKKSTGNYLEVAGNLDPDVRSFTDLIPEMTNYYVIRAFDVNKQTSSSFPTLVQLIDSFPPAKPDRPRATIDTLGNVTLSWTKGIEEDILGYRVFSSNFLNAEFGQQSKSAITDTFFTEQINLKNLSNKIYYKIAAIDQNFNQSELSEAFLLEKPDLMSPTPPLFKLAKSTVNGVQLHWINSSSKDVAKYLLYRGETGQEKWDSIASFFVTDSVNSYTDKQITAKSLYEYTMIAVDKSGNESEPCKAVFARKIDNGIRSSIQNIKTETDRIDKKVKLTWDYTSEDVKNYLIYRALNDERIAYYKIIKADKNKFTDNDVQINTIYKYRIKAVFNDGSESNFSEEINVKY